MSSASSLSENQATIVSKCMGRGLVIFFDNYVVKRDQSDILHQGDTLAFVYAASKDCPGAPRVPEVYECFSWNGLEYLVMERVDHPTVEAWIKASPSETEKQSRSDIAHRAVADAVRWLSSLSPPADAEIGLIEGPYARTIHNADVRARRGRSPNVFFGCNGAAWRYTNAAALERHIKKALSLRPRRAPPQRVKISDEPLMLIQCNITPKHFLIDPETQQVTINDFSCVCVLPHSFANFALGMGGRFATRVNKHLGWKPTPNFPGLQEATYIYGMSGVADFGLGKDGFPLQRLSSSDSESPVKV